MKIVKNSERKVRGSFGAKMRLIRGEIQSVEEFLGGKHEKNSISTEDQSPTIEDGSPLF